MIKVNEKKQVQPKEPGEAKVLLENTKIQKQEREAEIQGAGGEERLKEGKQDPELAKKQIRSPKALKTLKTLKARSQTPKRHKTPRKLKTIIEMFENKPSEKKKKEKDTLEETREKKDTESQENQEKIQEKNEFKHPRIKTSSYVTPYKKNTAKVARSPKPSNTRSTPITKLNSPKFKIQSNQKNHLKGTKSKQKQTQNVTDIRRYFETFTAEIPKNPQKQKPPDNPNYRAAFEAKYPNQIEPKFILPEASRINQGGIKGKYMGKLATSLSSCHATDNSELD